MNEREVLECYFELDPEWTRKTIDYIKDLVQLSEKQIYKWGYEKRCKLNVCQKDDRAINSSLVTKAEDLMAPIDPNNYNQVVWNLFPEKANEDEVLTEGQKDVYNYVRDQLIARNAQYEKQSDLDKLLNERIPIRTIALQAKAAQDSLLEGAPAMAKNVSDFNKQEEDQTNFQIKNYSNFENCEDEAKIEDLPKPQFETSTVTAQHLLSESGYNCTMTFGPDGIQPIIDSNSLRLFRKESYNEEVVSEPIQNLNLDGCTNKIIDYSCIQKEPQRSRSEERDTLVNSPIVSFKNLVEQAEGEMLCESFDGFSNGFIYY